MTKKEIKNLELAGRDYVADWLCWNEKKLAALSSVEEKRRFIQSEAHFESCAGDMADYDENGKRSWQDRESAADYIYEGMHKTVELFLAGRRY